MMQIASFTLLISDGNIDKPYVALYTLLWTMSRKLTLNQERQIPSSSSGRSTPEVARRRQPPEDGMYALSTVIYTYDTALCWLSKSGEKHKDKNYRKYAAGIERALSLGDNAQQEWADYIDNIGQNGKVIKLVSNNF